MKQYFWIGLLSLGVGSSLVAAETKVSNVEGVKSYLLSVTSEMALASQKFIQHADTYAKLVAEQGGDHKKAYAKNKAEMTKLVSALQDDYKAMDSFGYERVEGIVAGVPSLADFDVYLDAGVPKTEASADAPAAPVTLLLTDGGKIDQQGSLFTFIIEPMLWGGNPKWCVPVDLNGDGKLGDRESLPKTEVLQAAARNVHEKLQALLTASQEWKPSTEDCFAAIVAMTPTLSGYFDDWKESRYSAEKSGRFQAVSRVSDMRGIMTSVAILYAAVQPQVEKKDKALAKSIQGRGEEVLSFVDRVDEREKKAKGQITVAEIDELSNQAKQKADKLVPQVEQAAAILSVKLSQG